MRIVETWDISSWSLFFSEHGKQLQIGHHEESKNSFFLAFGLAFCTKLGLPHRSYSCHSMMSQTWIKFSRPDQRHPQHQRSTISPYFLIHQLEQVRQGKIFKKQDKMPMWAVEKQYFEMPKLVGFQTMGFWTTMVWPLILWVSLVWSFDFKSG